MGFEQEGVRRGYVFLDGEHRDVADYGLLREHWDGPD
jgi:ribosomal-protein-alanine N-acetyltransferase